jgi:hypothetical protein
MHPVTLHDRARRARTKWTYNDGPMGWRDLFKTSAEEEVFCSFCGKSRREVRKLISGPKVFICDDCVGLCVGILFEEGGGPAWLAELLRNTVSEMPTEVIPAALSAAQGAADGDPDRLRLLADKLATRGGADFVRAALATRGLIAEPRRRPDDVHTMVMHAFLLGDLPSALRANDAMIPEGRTEGWRLSAILIELHTPPVASARALELAAEIRAMREPGLEVARACIEACAQQRGGRAEAAVALYEPHRDGLLPWHLVTLGDALAATGHRAGAEAAWQRVVDAPWPHWQPIARQRIAAPPEHPFRR